MAYPLDLDAETISLDGHWYTRDELARRIKTMLDAGDFSVTRPSQALEQLTQTLAALRTIAFRAPPDLADALAARAARLGKTPGGVVREALIAYLGAGDSLGLATQRALTPQPVPVAVQPLHVVVAAATAPQGSEEPLQPIPLVESVAPSPDSHRSDTAPIVPTVVVDQPVAVAAAQAPDPAQQKKREEEEIERRWFGG